MIEPKVTKYGVLVDRHNGCEIYQENGKYTIVNHGDVVGTSNCIEGAYVVASLGKQGVKDVFNRRKK